MLHVFAHAMVLHPHVQERAQEEIDRVCGAKRSPTHEDDLPYVKYVYLLVAMSEFGANRSLCLG